MLRIGNRKSLGVPRELVLFGCCLLQGGSLGIVQNSMGVFFQAICSDLGFSSGGIALYRTISGLSSCIMLPFVGKILYRTDSRVSMTVCAVLYAGSTMLMGSFSQLWQWYGTSFIQGLAGAMLLYASAPIILANWYPDKMGFAVGISGSFSGLMGMVGNMATGKVVEALGWRIAYMAAGGISMLMLLPATLFLIRLSPDHTMVSQPKQKQAPAKLTPKQWLPAFLVAFMSTATMFCVGFSPVIVTFTTSIGHTAMYGTLLVSITMLSNAVGKILLGRVNDRYGLGVCCMLGTVISVAAFAFFFASQKLWLNIGGVLYGIGMALSVVTPPLLVQKFYSNEVYPYVFSVVITVYTFASAFAPSALGTIYDLTGSFDNALWLCMGLSALFAAMGFLLKVLCKCKEFGKISLTVTK